MMYKYKSYIILLQILSFSYTSFSQGHSGSQDNNYFFTILFITLFNSRFQFISLVWVTNFEPKKVTKKCQSNIVVPLPPLELVVKQWYYFINNHKFRVEKNVDIGYKYFCNPQKNEGFFDTFDDLMPLR